MPNNQTSLTELLKSFFNSEMKSVNTSIPGHIASFDPATQLAQIQIGIKRFDADGVAQDPAILVECPVQFAGGGGYVIEHQLDPGDEGIIIFSQRCIDGWSNSGGVAENPVLRLHDISDAYFIPGIRSQPNTASGFANDGIKLRNEAGDSYIHMTAGGIINVVALSFTINGAELVAHVHGGVTTGGGSTGPLI